MKTKKVKINKRKIVKNTKEWRNDYCYCYCFTDSVSNKWLYYEWNTTKYKLKVTVYHQWQRKRIQRSSCRQHDKINKITLIKRVLESFENEFFRFHFFPFFFLFFHFRSHFFRIGTNYLLILCKYLTLAIFRKIVI